MGQWRADLKKILAPAGNGVFTVHTAAERKSQLHKILYQSDDAAQVKNIWENQIANLEDSNRPLLLGTPSDTGGGILRGANWGPLFVRQQMLQTASSQAEMSYDDIGDIRVIPHLLHDKYLNQETINSCRLALYDNEKINLPVSPLSLAEKVASTIYENLPSRPLLSIGGDHSVSYPLVKAWLERKSSKNIKKAILHFDAHTDLLDKRLGIDICFASWAYHMIEKLAHPELLYQVGIRSSGKDKAHWENSLGIKQVWADEAISMGSSKLVNQIITLYKQHHIEEVYVSFDIDTLDTDYASSTGTPEKGGLEPHFCLAIINELAKNFKITGADVVEVSPFLNTKLNTKASEPEATLISAQIIADGLLRVMSENNADH